MSEKYGFVYIWFDKKRKMFYIGCHWGTTEDGYVCSSDRMRKSYRRRPEDFKRRILKRFDNREEMFKEEQRILNSIADGELGKKYYNLCKNAEYHWSRTDEGKKTVSDKLKNNPKTKETWRKKFENGYVIHNKGKPNPEHGQKLREKYASGELVNPNKGRKYKLNLTEEQKEKRRHQFTSEQRRENGRKGGLAVVAKGGSGFMLKRQQKSINKVQNT